jgi:hypothetical protein
VVRAADRFLTDGIEGLYDRRRGNGTSKTGERFDRVLVRVLACTPEDFGRERPTWARELLCLQMKLEGLPAVAVCTMDRALSRVGARLGTPKPIVLCPLPRGQRPPVLAAIRRLEARASAKEPVLYSDEVDTHLNPKVGRDWMLRCHQRRIVTPGNNEKFYLAGALDVRTGRLHTTGAARKNVALFCQLLWLLASRYRRAERIHLIVDNYCIHKARRTRQVLAALGGRASRPRCAQHLVHDLGMPRDDREQRARRPFRRAPPLLPVTHRGDVQPEHPREAGLGEAEPLADRLDVDALGWLILPHRKLDLAARPSDGFRETLDERFADGLLAALLCGFCSASHGSSP